MKAWTHKGLRFIVVPLFWLAAWFTSSYFATAWLVVLGTYIILISAMGIMNIPGESDLSSKLVWVMRLFNGLGPLAWGGFLALLYWLIYVLIFHFDGLNVR